MEMLFALGPLAPFLLGAFGLLVVGAVAYFGWQQSVKRREALFALATANGLIWSRQDHLGIAARYPFVLWRAGDERRWENLITGELAGKPVLLFDYTYVDVSRDSDGRDQRTTHAFTCAIAPLDGAFTPGLQLEPENAVTWLKDKVGMRDLELESEEFNRRFEVGARNRQFAVAFLDARMIQWLLATPRTLRFEVLGGHVLVIAPKAAPEQWLLHHHIATDFASRMPNVVRSLFPV